MEVPLEEKIRGFYACLKSANELSSLNSTPPASTQTYKNSMSEHERSPLLLDTTSLSPGSTIRILIYSLTRNHQPQPIIRLPKQHDHDESRPQRLSTNRWNDDQNGSFQKDERLSAEVVGGVDVEIPQSYNMVHNIHFEFSHTIFINIKRDDPKWNHKCSSLHHTEIYLKIEIIMQKCIVK
jgi:hypothetical protein